MNVLKLLSANILLVMFALLVSCSEDEDAVLKVSNTSIAFDKGGGSRTVVVATDQDSWDAIISYGDEDQFELKQQADELTIVSKTNETEDVLTATVSVKAGNSTVMIHITQSGVYDITGGGDEIKFEIKPDLGNYIYNYKNQKANLMIETAVVWYAVSDKDWCVVHSNARRGRMDMDLDENNGVENRTATISFYTEDDAQLIKQITVEQKSKANEDYSVMMGSWDLYCGKWEQGGEILPGGTYTSATLKPNVDLELIEMTGLFFFASVHTVYYAEDTGELIIPFGTRSQVIALPDVDYYAYIAAMDPETGDVISGELIGKMSEDKKTIALEGLDDNLILGMFLGNSSGTYFSKLSDTPYLLHSGIELRRPENQSAEVNINMNGFAKVTSKNRPVMERKVIGRVVGTTSLEELQLQHLKK